MGRIVEIGRAMRRKEDARLLTGRGRFAADFRLPGMLQGAVLRSPHAHARVHAIRPEAALALPGVVAVVTAADLGAIGRIPVRLGPRPASAIRSATSSACSARSRATRSGTSASPWPSSSRRAATSRRTRSS